jgi:epoxyqueuosine reductase
VGELERKIKEEAARLGFDLVGITSIAPLLTADVSFNAWCESGFAAGMEYMTRRPELNAHPSRLAPWAASLITLSVNYYAEAPPFEHENRYGRIARYAWGLDYHDVVKSRLVKLAAELERLANRPLHTRCFVDAVPLLERAAAARAGTGFFGKNTNLLQPRGGSWFFLAEVLVAMELEADDREVKVSCGSCQRCIAACPTDAFPKPYVLDSRRCISYLTIENKGMIDRDLRQGLGEWIFGCDVCQEVCPFNRFSSDTAWPELQPESGAGSRLDLAEILSISTDEEFRARFRGTPLLRSKRRGLLRNAAVVAANIGCTAAVPALVDRILNDPEPLIRSHAFWALSRLDSARAFALADRLMLREDDSLVHDEVAAFLNQRSA